MTRNKWLIAAAAALVAAVGWYFGSPYYTLLQMRDAARAKDAEKLSAYVDYPSLREDMKAEFTAQLAALAREHPSDAASLVSAIGPVMASPVIERMISPEGVRAMFVAAEEKEARRGPASEPPVEAGDNPVIERRGLSEFAVRSKDHPEGAIIFTRHGLGWKLSGVDLPAND